MSANIRFECRRGYLRSFGADELFCGVRKTDPANPTLVNGAISYDGFQGLWILNGGIPGEPMVCTGSKEICPDLNWLVANSISYHLAPLNFGLSSVGYLR